MKYSKKISRILVLSVFFSLASCHTRVVSPNKPMTNTSLKLNRKYTIQTKDAKSQRIEVLKVDDAKIYGKNKAGEMVEIEKTEVREIKKPALLASIVLGLAAVAAVVFIPI